MTNKNREDVRKEGWTIIKDKTGDHCLEVKYDDGSTVFPSGDKKGIPIYPYSAVCKWDGCVHFYAYSNGYGADHECEEDCQCMEGYRHICDIDYEIKLLQDLKATAMEFFKGKTGEEYWR